MPYVAPHRPPSRESSAPRRRGWIAFITLAILVGGRGAGHAEDAPPAGREAGPAAPAKPKPTPTAAQVADDVVAALTRGDDVALRHLAGRDDPDPWIVADELLRRGAPDAAAAFAAAEPRPDTEALPAYVAHQRGRADDTPRRERFAAALRALVGGDAAGALRELGDDQDQGSDVVGVRLARLRAHAVTKSEAPAAAEAAWLSVATLAAALGWARLDFDACLEATRHAAAAGRLPSVERASRRAADVARRRKDPRGEAVAELNLAFVSYERGEVVAAGRKFLELAERFADLGDRRNEAVCRANAGSVQASTGDLEGARSSYLAAAEAHERNGALDEVVHVRTNVATLDIELGRPGDALRVLDALRPMIDRVDVSRRLAFLSAEARALHLLGDYGPALDRFEQVRAGWAALGHDVNAAAALANVAAVHGSRGDVAAALRAQERALPVLRRGRSADENWPFEANAARTLADIGDVAEAERRLLALAASLDRGKRESEAARVRLDLAEILTAHGRAEEALALAVPATATLEAAGATASAGDALRALATHQRNVGRYDDALATLDRAQAVLRHVGDRIGLAQVEVARALVQAGRREFDVARASLASARAVFEGAADGGGAAGVDEAIASLEFRAGRPVAAVAAALRAADWIVAATEGLGEVQGAERRSVVADGVALGVSAAAAIGDSAAAVRLIETLRARGLLEALRGGDALREQMVSSALRTEESVARGRVTRAQRRLRAASDKGDLEGARAARRDFDEAARALVAVVERIRGESRRSADLVLPAPADEAAIRKMLAPGDALVLYASRAPAAVVVRASGSRVVRLGAVRDVEAVVAALELSDPGSGSDAVAAARRALVDPLGLEDDVRRVLVSPDGVLAHVPFAVLMPGRALSYVPSATTYGLLRDEEALRGEGVLALGDPDYAAQPERGSSGRLTPLPATRDEVLAIGTTRLLGADATVPRLRDALAAHARWKAVHLACHGLVDIERPALSSLAVTSSGDDDGLLTCLDVFRMRVPAELVVLSACETAKGRVVHGEGIVGLARAFMFAGSPRVLCSLWKVDDAATATLMKRFYELWNPKAGVGALGAAEALQKAQEYVRTHPQHPEWEHPYFWAAWVLWGPPS